MLSPQKDYYHEYTNILIGFALIERLDDSVLSAGVELEPLGLLRLDNRIVQEHNHYESARQGLYIIR